MCSDLSASMNMLASEGVLTGLDKCLLCAVKRAGGFSPLFKHFPIHVSLDKASIDKRLKKSIVDS